MNTVFTEETYRFLVRLFVIALCVLIPFPQAVNMINAVALFLLATFIYGLLKGYVSFDKRPYGLPLLFVLYSLIYPVSLLWTEDIEWGKQLVERHWFFLLFPIIYYSVDKDSWRTYLRSYLYSFLIVEVVSYGVFWGLWSDPSGYGSAMDPVVFNPHTVYTYLAAFGFFIAFVFFMEEERWSNKLIYLFFTCVIAANIFISGGRGGQFAWILLSVTLIYFYTRGRVSKQKRFFYSFVLSVIVTLVLGLVWKLYPPFQQRINLAWQEVENFSPTSKGSWTFRIFMYHNALELFINEDWKSRLMGVGIGDLPEAYNKAVEKGHYEFYLEPRLKGHHHPHNQFLFDLISIGMVGLGILLFIYFLMMRCLKNYPFRDTLWLSGVGLLILSVWMNIPDSLFLSRSTQLLFVVLSAILFSSLCALPHEKTDL